MIGARPFLFQSSDGDVYHVTQAGVKTIKSLSTAREPITALIDGDLGNCQPKGFLIRDAVQLIVAASPKGAAQGWTKQTGGDSHVDIIAVKLWSRKELLLTGLALPSLSTLN
jgi:hypothetical protein